MNSSVPSDISVVRALDCFCQALDDFLAVLLTNVTNCRTTAEASPRRDAKLRIAFGTIPLILRYVTPSMFIRCSEAGTKEMPRPAATRLSVEVIRGAC